MKLISAGILATVAFPLIAGCASSRDDHEHLRAPRGADHAMACRLCYDETQRVLLFKSKVYKSRRSVYQTTKTHACPDCKTEAVF